MIHICVWYGVLRGEKSTSPELHLSHLLITNKLKPLFRLLFLLFAGIEFRFGCAVDDIEVSSCSENTPHTQGINKITGLILRDGSTLPADVVVMAPGHSARSLYQKLIEKGVSLEPKPIAVSTYPCSPPFILFFSMIHPSSVFLLQTTIFPLLSLLISPCLIIPSVISSPFPSHFPLSHFVSSCFPLFPLLSLLLRLLISSYLTSFSFLFLPLFFLFRLDSEWNTLKN